MLFRLWEPYKDREYISVRKGNWNADEEPPLPLRVKGPSRSGTSPRPKPSEHRSSIFFETNDPSPGPYELGHAPVRDSPWYRVGGTSPVYWRIHSHLWRYDTFSRFWYRFAILWTLRMEMSFYDVLYPYFPDIIHIKQDFPLYPQSNHIGRYQSVQIVRPKRTCWCAPFATCCKGDMTSVIESESPQRIVSVLSRHIWLVSTHGIGRYLEYYET